MNLGSDRIGSFVRWVSRSVGNLSRARARARARIVDQRVRSHVRTRAAATIQIDHQYLQGEWPQCPFALGN
jgi:hypothetical protein